MRLNRVIAAILALSLWVGATGEARQGDAKPKGGIAVWDTGKASAEPLAPSALAARSGWTEIKDATLASFKGDAVVTNGRVTAILRKSGSSAEIYGAEAALAQLRLLAAGGEAVARFERIALTEGGRGGATLEIAGKTSKGAGVAAKLRIKRGDVAVEIEPGRGADRARIECPSRFIVLPDFFADDIVIDSMKIPTSPSEIPSENFVLHLANRNHALVMGVFQNKDQDVRLTLAGDGEKRTVTGSEIEFGREGKPERKVWIAVLEAPHIWHTVDIKPADAGKVLPLDWKMPFPAAWRCDFMRPNDLSDSWEMLLQKEKEGEFRKPSWLGAGADRIPADRKRWTTVLGTFKYPVWSDEERKGYLQPLKHELLTFRGPALIYPINRVQDTPLEAFTAVDVVRNTLGVGPCEYILDLEGNKSEYKGRATCATRDLLTGIYSKGEQKAKHKEVDAALDAALVFVKHIRGRITRYVDFGHKIRDYLAAQKKAHPELKDPIGELEKITAELDARYSARQEKIKTPEYVAGMNEDFRKNVLDYEGPDAIDRAKKYAKALVEVGSDQDELSGECRWVVKALRQKAGLLMAQDLRMAPIATEIRAKTQEVLRNPAGHEGARH